MGVSDGAALTRAWSLQSAQRAGLGSAEEAALSQGHRGNKKHRGSSGSVVQVEAQTVRIIMKLTDCLLDVT